jgi:hypothetical protein
MKVFVAFCAISIPLFAQNPMVPVPSACGNFDVIMAVELDASQHTIAGADPNKARIYFIQDTGLVTTIAYPTTKIGIDGQWVGANKKDSYFSISVEPGEHHLCAGIQSAFIRKEIELAHLKAEAGKVYYYRTRIVMSNSGPEYLGLMLVDSDEAQYLIESYPLAVAHARR